jgi:hypothetical protein
MNFGEGMRRLGIVLGVLGCAIVGFYSYFLGKEVHQSAVNGALKESLLADYAFLIALPVLGFFIPWGIIRAIRWVFLGFSTGSPERR